VLVSEPQVDSETIAGPADCAPAGTGKMLPSACATARSRNSSTARLCSTQKPFSGADDSLTFQWSQPKSAIIQRRFSEMKFFSEVHSWDVNIDSATEKQTTRFRPESVFTSLRNRYSHAPEYAPTVITGRVDARSGNQKLGQKRAVFLRCLGGITN
jgi:hypothetical protein